MPRQECIWVWVAFLVTPHGSTASSGSHCSLLLHISACILSAQTLILLGTSRRVSPDSYKISTHPFFSGASGFGQGVLLVLLHKASVRSSSCLSLWLLPLLLLHFLPFFIFKIIIIILSNRVNMFEN